MLSDRRTFLLIVTLAVSLSCVAFDAKAQCLEDPADAALVVRVSLVERTRSGATIALNLSGDSSPISTQLADGEVEEFSLVPGLYEYQLVAGGFEPRSGSVSVCGRTSLDVQLVPRATPTLRGTVYAGDDAEASGSTGATVTLRGVDERSGVIVQETVAEDGTYVVPDVPAGFYRIRFALERPAQAGQRTEYLHLTLPYVDVLDASQVDVRMVSNFDQPDTETSIACATTGGPGTGSLTGLATLLVLGLLSRGRRERA